jgi:hypothetical protein
MVKNPERVERFERRLIYGQEPDYQENLRIAEALYLEAVHLGVWPPKDPLEGIETLLETTRLIHLCRAVAPPASHVAGEEPAHAVSATGGQRQPT